MPRLPRRLAATFACAALTPLAAQAAPARPRVGVVLTVAGEAMAHWGAEPARSLVATTPLLLEDTLATSRTGRLSGRLLSELTLRLGANATLRLDRVALGGAAPGIALSSLGGALLLDRPPPAAGVALPPPITLDLPWARLAVRGTRFFAGPLDGVEAVFVERGEVAVALIAGPAATLRAGEGLDIGNPVSQRWGAARIARALALLD